jgi:hypothetical protein
MLPRRYRLLIINPRAMLAWILVLSSATAATAEPAISKVGNIIFTPTSTLLMELGGTSPGSQHDQIQASGVIGFNGTLQVTLINGFSPSTGQWFDLFDFQPENQVGTFTSINVPTLSGLAWNISQLYTTGILSVAEIIPGDFNLDGAVDAADYVVWRKGAGVATTTPNYNLWRANFGRTNGGGGSAAPDSAGGFSAAVPEPNSCLLACFAALATFVRRNRRRLDAGVRHSNGTPGLPMS